jgi:hypothetical protein
MSRWQRFVTPWWLGGAALAAFGVIVVRMAAPHFASAVQPLVKVAGELLALGGLLVIAWGVSRRVRSVPPA